MRDFQQDRVYKWERPLISGAWVEFENIQPIVDYMWSDLGFEHPPRVKLMHKNVTRWAGQANRLNLWFPERGASTRTIIHELAHSLTCNIDGESNLHNEWFVGVYMTLLEKYMDIPAPYLWYTAEKAGVRYEKYPKMGCIVTKDDVT